MMELVLVIIIVIILFKIKIDEIKRKIQELLDYKETLERQCLISFSIIIIILILI